MRPLRLSILFVCSPRRGKGWHSWINLTETHVANGWNGWGALDLSLDSPEAWAPLCRLLAFCWKTASLPWQVSWPTSATCTCCKGALHFMVYLGPTGTRLLMSGDPLVGDDKNNVSNVVGPRKYQFVNLTIKSSRTSRDFSHEKCYVTHFRSNKVKIRVFNEARADLKLYIRGFLHTTESLVLNRGNGHFGRNNTQ